MKINCMEKFDIEKLRKCIAEFEVLERKEPYAIMSRDTLYLLANECTKDLSWSLIKEDENSVSSFEGTIIFNNNDFPLGIVELR